MIDKNHVKQVAKAHFINLNTSGAMAQIFSILNTQHPTSDRAEKARRLDVITDYLAAA